MFAISVNPSSLPSIIDDFATPFNMFFNPFFDMFFRTSISLSRDTFSNRPSIIPAPTPVVIAFESDAPLSCASNIALLAADEPSNTVVAPGTNMLSGIVATESDILANASYTNFPTSFPISSLTPSLSSCVFFDTLFAALFQSNGFSEPNNCFILFQVLLTAPIPPVNDIGTDRIVPDIRCFLPNSLYSSCCCFAISSLFFASAYPTTASASLLLKPYFFFKLS